MLEEQMLAFALMGAEWVLWLLVILSVLVLAITVERAVYGVVNRSPAADFEAALAAYLASGDLEVLHGKLADMKGIEARVLAAGADAARHGGAPAAEEAIAGTLTFERIRLERGLIVIGTTGANAPFVGLFGTVLGIIKAFNDLSLETAEAAGAVMAGISEALVATAVGLLVAIPAVVVYNWFSRRNKEQLARVESLSHLMLSRIIGRSQGAGSQDADAQEREGAGVGARRRAHPDSRSA